MTEYPYVVVLAGGEGTRLVSLTRALYGTDPPKQFAALDGDLSLLQQTVERALAMTTADRISVIVTGHREAIAHEQLVHYPGVELVVQPRGPSRPSRCMALAGATGAHPSACLRACSALQTTTGSSLESAARLRSRVEPEATWRDRRR